MECKVPGCVPGVLPLVRHRDDIIVDHVEPLAIADRLFVSPVQRMGVMFLQPLVSVEVVVLFGPEHPGKGLAYEVDAVVIRLESLRGQGVIELVRLLEPLVHYRIELSRTDRGVRPVPSPSDGAGRPALAPGPTVSW